MPDRRQALETAAEMLRASLATTPDAKKPGVLEAIDDIEDEIDDQVLADLLGAAQAVGRAADAMNAVIGTVNQHAPQQVAQAARDALAELQRLRNPNAT